MERIFILGLVLFLIEGGMFMFSPLSLVVLTIFLLGGLFYFIKLRYLEVYIISLFFLLRLLFSINFNEYVEGDTVLIKTRIRSGYGYIEKIDNRYPLFYKNIYENSLEEGDYILKGEIEESTKRYIRLNIKDKVKKEESFLRDEYKKRLENLRFYMSNQGVNLIEAMIIGEKGDLDRKLKEQFRYVGSSHLLAISGLHIGIVLGLILGGLKFLHLKREVNYSLGFIFLTIYILSINKSPSVMRAYIMGVIYLVSQVIYEKNQIEKAFCLSFIMNLFISPNSFSNISFVLSYVSVFTILWIYPKFMITYKVKGREVYNYLIFLLTIQIMLTPLSLYYFKTFGLLSYFTNLIITPLGSIFIVMSFIGSLMPKIFLGIYGEVLDRMYQILNFILEKFESLPWLSIKIDKQISLELVLMIYLLGLMYIYRNKIINYIKVENENNRKR